MSKRSSNSDLGKEDRVVKRQRRKEEFDKLQRKMQRLQREIKLFSSEGSSGRKIDYKYALCIHGPL
nr:unnamed protein product [Callosobruchus chinensis]